MSLFAPKFSPTLARETAEAMRKNAESTRLTAGYNGSFDDGGSAASLREIAAFEAGMSGAWPNDEWARVAYSISIRHADPEFPKYLELKKKFER